MKTQINFVLDDETDAVTREHLKNLPKGDRSSFIRKAILEKIKREKKEAQMDLTPQAPSVETLDKLELWPYVRRALGLIHAVHEVKDGWIVNSKYTVRVTKDRDGILGWECPCPNWEHQGEQHGDHCKHTLAVCLQDESYRELICEALEERVDIR